MNTEVKNGEEPGLLSQPGKKRIVVLLVLAAAIAGIIFYVYSSAGSILEKRFLEAIDEPLGPDRQWVYDEIDVGLLPPRLTITGLEIDNIVPFEDQRLETEIDAIRNFRAEKIEVKALGFRDLIRSFDLNLGTVKVHSPEIEALFRPTADIDTNGDDKVFDVIRIEEIDILNAGIHLFAYRVDEEPAASIIGSDLAIRDFKLADDNMLIRHWAPYYSFRFDEAFFEYPEFNYRVELGESEYHSDSETLSIRHSKVIPTLSPQEMAEEKGEEVDHFDIASGPVELAGFDPDDWVGERLLHGSHLIANDLRMYISRDKNFPDKVRTERPLPSVMFKNFPYSIKLDSVMWTDGLISYREWREDQDQYGEVRFEEVNLTAYDFQNRDEELPIVVNGTTSLMGQSTLNAEFTFHLDNVGTHSIKGELENMDLTTFNDVLSPLALVKVRRGELERLEIDIEADNQRATGEVLMIYDDLSIRKLDDETLEESTSTRLVSFVANITTVRSSNDPDDPRMGTVDFERDPERSMFTYWWYSLREGLEKSAGM